VGVGGVLGDQQVGSVAEDLVEHVVRFPVGRDDDLRAVGGVDADRVLVTIVYQRQICSQNVLSACWRQPELDRTRHRRDPPTARRTQPHHPPDHAAFHHRRR